MPNNEINLYCYVLKCSSNVHIFHNYGFNIFEKRALEKRKGLRCLKRKSNERVNVLKISRKRVFQINAMKLH